MYTIKQASRLTGVSEASLRAWERRYGVVVPHRNESGYRVYDEEALAAVSTMRRLVDDGWSPAEAADAVRSGTVPAVLDEVVSRESLRRSPPTQRGHLHATVPVLGSADGHGGNRGEPRWRFRARIVRARGRLVALPHPRGARRGLGARRDRRSRGACGQPRGPSPALGRVRRGRQQVPRSGGRGRAALGQPARPRCPGVCHRDPQEGHGRSLPRCQRAGEQLGGGGAQPRGPSSGAVCRHSRGPPGRGRGGRATAQPGPGPDGVRRWGIRSEPCRWSPDAGIEHRVSSPGGDAPVAPAPSPDAAAAARPSTRRWPRRPPAPPRGRHRCRRPGP